jgi:hypothetical protein
MLDSLFITPAVDAVSEALASADAHGTLAVIGHAKLASALADARKAAGDEVLAIGMSERAAKRLTNALADLSGLANRSLAGVIGVDIAVDDGWELTLRDWVRVTRDGGVLVFVDRGHAVEASRRALCAGLTEIEQRHAGRTIVTSGLVTHL